MLFRRERRKTPGQVSDRRAPSEVQTDDYKGPDRRTRAPGSVGRRYSDRKGPRHLRDGWMLLLTVIVLVALGNQRTDQRQHAREQRSTTSHLAANQRQVHNLALKTAANQQENTKALCSFRNELQQRVTGTVTFIKDHPAGIPGIPTSVLKVSLQNEQATLRALSPLTCPKPTKPTKQHK